MTVQYSSRLLRTNTALAVRSAYVIPYIINDVFAVFYSCPVISCYLVVFYSYCMYCCNKYISLTTRLVIFICSTGWSQNRTTVLDCIYVSKTLEQNLHDYTTVFSADSSSTHLLGLLSPSGVKAKVIYLSFRV